MERFNLKKLSDWTLKNNTWLKSQTGVQLWEARMIMWFGKVSRENIKISAEENPDYYEFNRHKTWFDEKNYILLDPRRCRHRWEDNTKMNLKDVRWEDLDRVHLAQDRDQWQGL
jgi:hypothetical protein